MRGIFDIFFFDEIQSRSVEAVIRYSFLKKVKQQVHSDHPTESISMISMTKASEAAQLDEELGGRFMKTSTGFFDDWDEIDRANLPKFLVGQIQAMRARKSRIEAKVLYKTFGKNECFECDLTMITLKSMLLLSDYHPPRDSFFSGS